ncbi:MAG TPA: ECF-type sigma factor, partial [Myxococcota bacterium]|nr:ECF-type sigma factor [Myxococcota bacterium]
MGSGLGDDLEIPRASRPELDALFSLTYEELRRLAASVRRREAGGTLSPTVLVNEAWLKLAGAPPRALSQLHFKRIAARAMRQVLVEAARRRDADKRGAGFAPVTLDESAPAPTGASELLELDAALSKLAALSPRQAALIECRFFGGMDVAETAALLEVSEATLL